MSFQTKGDLALGQGATGETTKDRAVGGGKSSWITPEGERESRSENLDSLRPLAL